MPTGGCLCGAVRYEFDGEPYGGAICHCRTCQRTHAAPLVGFFSVRLADIRITGALAEYRSSDHAVRRFCPTCGTHLFFDDADYPDEIDVAAATLDDPSVFHPRFHIWVHSQAPWVKLGDGLRAFPERSHS